jgi:hypothetical protein
MNAVLQIWRDNVVLMAIEYANFSWKPSEEHRFHGLDTDRILVNTPDTNYKSAKFPGCNWWQIDQVNTGVPYNWGGASTLAEFEKGILEGKFAGNVPDSRDNGASRYCVGVDCSGLVTICWGIERKLSTKTIPMIAAPMESLNQLLPGDVILLAGRHVLIFIDFMDTAKTRVRIIDSSRSTGRVLMRTEIISDLESSGYIGYRKL